MQRKALGKGLEALFGSYDNEPPSDEKSSARKIITIPLNDIIPNRNQPRVAFTEEAMEELKKSIAENGILEPPIVRRNGDYYELVAGERRYRAAKELNFGDIDVILMDVESDDKMIVLSLVENIQREDLNAIEEAGAYRQIMNRMSITQEELSGIVGKNRSTIANTLRLLALPEEIQKMVSGGVLAPGSARPLVTVPEKDLQYKLAKRISKEGLSARKAEALVKRAITQTSKIPSQKELSPFLNAIREDLQRLLGTQVKMKGDEGKGRIEIAYYSRDDLERILETLKGGVD